jgi:sulfotransferase family protein
VTSELPPFFLVGNDRSGTTMLRLILDRSDVAVPPESMFLADFAPVRRAGGLEDPERAARLVREVWNHPRVRAWKLEGGPPSVPGGLRHEQAYRFVVSAPFEAYAAAQGKSRWGDKTPLYLRFVDELHEVWPEARFVVLVRDGRDVALSVKRVPFGANNAWAAAQTWAHGIRLGLEAERRYPDQVLTVRYEDVVAEPGAQVARLCLFLGLPFEDGMLAIERTDPAKIHKDQADWFTNVWAGINTSAVGKWKTAMSARDQRVFSSVAGAELEALGYEPVEADGAPSAWPYVAHDAAMRGVNFVKLRVVQERGREIRYVLKRKLAGQWR